MGKRLLFVVFLCFVVLELVLFASAKRKITNLDEEIVKFEAQLKRSGDKEALKEWVRVIKIDFINLKLNCFSEVRPLMWHEVGLLCLIFNKYKSML